MRFELEPFCIKVVILEPGAIQTEFGEVLVKPMMKRSGNGPYQLIARSLEKATLANYEKANSSSPSSVISKTIQKIITAANPKTRYLVGKYAKPTVALRKWTGDRAFDRVLKVMVK